MEAPQVRAYAVNHAVTPQLLALSEGPNLALDKPIVLIGRHQECDIQIPSRKISRRHCCIAQVADHIVIRDLGSTNGVRINGIKILEGQLKPNDELMIGNMRYQLKWNAESGDLVAKNGIKAGQPPNGRDADLLQSLEDPMALPDLALSHPVLKAQAKANSSEHGAKPLSLEIPEEIHLIPLDPPSLSG